MNVERAGTVALFGLPITNVSMPEAVGRIQDAIQSGRTHQIATANLDFARNSLRDPLLQQVICECSMVLPDGAPMLWASMLYGKPLKERVTGVDLIPELARLSAERGHGIFLLGSDDRTAMTASQVLTQKFPGVKIVGRYSPPVAPLEEMEDERMLQLIEHANPAILLVAFGNPKQELWIHRNRKRLKVPVSVGIGGALEMIAGNVKRAPAWLQMLQLEWFFRMVQEPFRLLPRYIGDAATLMRHLPMVLGAKLLQPDRMERGTLNVTDVDAVRVVSTPATLSGEHCASLLRETHGAVDTDRALVIDMSATTRVEADGLGCLLQARRVMLNAQREFWLTEISRPVHRVLQFSAMLDLFRIANSTKAAVAFAAHESDACPCTMKLAPAAPKLRHSMRQPSAEAIEV